jgi:hypothetical protein
MDGPKWKIAILKICPKNVFKVEMNKNASGSIYSDKDLKSST